jgi:hypothetical protein
MKKEEKGSQDFESFVIFTLMCLAIIMMYSLIHEIYINLNK